MLKRQKERFKSGLIHSAEEFKKKTNAALEDFNSRGPFKSAVGAENALLLIAEFRVQLNILTNEENVIRSGLNIFKIDHPQSKDLQALDKDLERIQQIWEITKTWEESWNKWKYGTFSSLETQSMESMAQGYYKKLNKLSREVKVCAPSSVTPHSPNTQPPLRVGLPNSSLHRSSRTLRLLCFGSVPPSPQPSPGSNGSLSSNGSISRSSHSFSTPFTGSSQS
uniref:Dynein heavy chain linker domain-containing protein n=1 Tax=Callorhinchus milii TaxID=7868 RepID=A0A4W3H929_CALMI